jgi:hypothetical protein
VLDLHPRLNSLILTCFPDDNLSSPDDEENPRVLFSELPDPLGRYQALKANDAHRRYEMNVPPVFKANGNRVHPFQYKSAVPEGTIVAIRGSMKM